MADNNKVTFPPSPKGEVEMTLIAGAEALMRSLGSSG